MRWWPKLHVAAGYHEPLCASTIYEIWEITMDLFDMKHLNQERQLQLDKVINLTLAIHSPLLYVRNKGKKGRREGIASSVYVSYLDQKFIITVGHTFSNYEYSDIHIQGVDISLEQDSDGIIFIPQKEGVAGLCDYYEMGYGIFRLNQEGIDKIEKLYKPFPISTEVKTKQFTAFYHFVFGYPSSQNIQRSLRKPFVGWHTTFRLPTYLGEISDCNYDIDRNLALKFSIDNTIRTHNLERGAYGRAPDPNGLSGCGIWATPEYPYNEGSYSLQGMLTHFNRKKGLLVGFRIQDVVEMIELVVDKLIELKKENNEKGIWISLPENQ